MDRKKIIWAIQYLLIIGVVFLAGFLSGFSYLCHKNSGVFLASTWDCVWKGCIKDYDVYMCNDRLFQVYKAGGRGFGENITTNWSDPASVPK